jgi:hypothetical protein
VLRSCHDARLTHTDVLVCTIRTVLGCITRLFLPLSPLSGTQSTAPYSLYACSSMEGMATRGRCQRERDFPWQYHIPHSCGKSLRSSAMLRWLQNSLLIVQSTTHPPLPLGWVVARPTIRILSYSSIRWRNYCCKTLCAISLCSISISIVRA